MLKSIYTHVVHVNILRVHYMVYRVTQKASFVDVHFLIPLSHEEWELLQFYITHVQLS